MNYVRDREMRDEMNVKTSRPKDTEQVDDTDLFKCVNG